MRKRTLALLVLSVLLMIAGIALLFGQPAPLPPITAFGSGAYTSQLSLAFDGGASATAMLARIGGFLLLGGLMLTSAAVGWRLGKVRHA